MVKGKNNKHKRQRSPTVTWSQFVVIILITIALAVVLDFGHRAAVSADLQREAWRLEHKVAALETENRALQAQQEWVQTGDYVKEWARTEGFMVLYGETPVVPVPGGKAAPAERATPAPPSESKAPFEGPEETSDHRQEWWALFFGPDEEPATPDNGE